MWITFCLLINWRFELYSLKIFAFFVVYEDSLLTSVHSVEQFLWHCILQQFSWLPNCFWRDKPFSCWTLPCFYFRSSTHTNANLIILSAITVFSAFSSIISSFSFEVHLMMCLSFQLLGQEGVRSTMDDAGRKLRMERHILLAW